MSDLTFAPVTEAEFEPLLALRIAVLRDDLERLGRFDPARARARFRAGYDPASLRLILRGGACIGCVALRPAADALWLEHFYLEPAWQGRGIGGAVLRRLLDEADAAGRPVRLGVLRGSRAARLYERHGFRFTHEEDWDRFYERPASADGGGVPAQAGPP